SPYTTYLSHLLYIYVSNSFYAFFTIMVPPPTTSTLFSYTTLFRSRGDRQAATSRGREPELARPHERRGIGCRVAAALMGARKLRDRKSTRLNSSHVAISYAVFCLKKKKKIKEKTKLKKALSKAHS